MKLKKEIAENGMFIYKVVDDEGKIVKQLCSAIDAVAMTKDGRLVKYLGFFDEEQKRAASIAGMSLYDYLRDIAQQIENIGRRMREQAAMKDLRMFKEMIDNLKKSLPSEDTNLVSTYERKHRKAVEELDNIQMIYLDEAE